MAEAHKFDPDGDLFAAVSAESRQRPLACVLVDEAQFLSREQVLPLARLADEADIPVRCDGLRTLFSAPLLHGSPAPTGQAAEPDALEPGCEWGSKAPKNRRGPKKGTA